MLPRPQTYQAKTYVPVTSAAIDPYEEEQRFLVDDGRLDKWFRYVEAELQRYRSPFVAAEALLTELRLRSHELYQPERLYVSTALRILQACVPHLTKETAQVVQAAVHELLPCLIYTRRTPLTTSTSAPSSSRGLEKVTQMTYAGAFRVLLKEWQKFQTQLRRLKGHARVEKRIMHLLVHGLDHIWLKMCFHSWRTFCRQLEVRKAQLRRRLQRGVANQALPAFLRVWRQYAHTIALDAKTSRNSLLQKQVEELYPLEQEVKSRYDHLCEEIKEKNRLVSDSLQRLEETKDRLTVLEELIAETQRSLTDHWMTWKECIRLMFDDIGEVPSKAAQILRTEYVMNITDTASTLSRRARGRASRMNVQNIAQFLLFQGELGANIDTHAVGEVDGMLAGKSSVGSSSAFRPVPHDADGTTLPATSGPEATHKVSTMPKRIAALHVQPSEHKPPPTVSATGLAVNVSDVYWTVATVVQPVLTPLHLTDVLHHNDAHLNITLSFLSTVYRGGHCSLFAPEARAARRTDATLLPPPLTEGFGQVSPTTEPKTESDGGDATAAAEDVNWGALMMQDVTRGMEKLQDCVDANEDYLLAVREGMMMNDMEVIQGYLEDLYTRWASTGVPLSQQKLESVWQPIVSPERLPILQALYPERGINCFTELVHYVTRVAEFSGCSLQALSERLDATYPYDPLDELRILRSSDEATELFREHAEHFATLLRYLKDEANPSQYHYDHLSVLLEQEFGLTPVEAADVSRYARHEVGDVVNHQDVEWLVLLSATYVDPSPFTSLLEKVARLLEDCIPLFQQLARATPVRR
ncbi:hypothetical protein, conserved [Leishmania tarentolae]|uniref:Uncharacterized protein n=1 Tax=Leishmania tarentolae TaxID=5689 RepID=A0A640KQ37_LEITA|nr:hypothetical protein, conserved [Leishmania tarentolae]